MAAAARSLGNENDRVYSAGCSRNLLLDGGKCTRGQMCLILSVAVAGLSSCDVWLELDNEEKLDGRNKDRKNAVEVDAVTS